MERMKFSSSSLTLFMLLLLLLPQMECLLPRVRPGRPFPVPLPLLPIPPPPPYVPPPLCVSQFALVNYACSLLPYYPAPPPAPPAPPTPAPAPAPPEEDSGRRRSRRRSHRRRHRRSEHDQGTPEEQDCCRWLKEVDTDCVCGLLVHLPVFLSKPLHDYTVKVDDVCNVTYTCSGRIRRI